MVHILYSGDIRDGEASAEHDIERLQAFRVKTRGGRYFHVLASDPAAVQRWLQTPEASPALDRMAVLEQEMADLKSALPHSK
jgi:hypothetical protein